MAPRPWVAQAPRSRSSTSLHCPHLLPPTTTPTSTAHPGPCCTDAATPAAPGAWCRLCPPHAAIPGRPAAGAWEHPQLHPAAPTAPLLAASHALARCTSGHWSSFWKENLNPWHLGLPHPTMLPLVCQAPLAPNLETPPHSPGPSTARCIQASSSLLPLWPPRPCTAEGRSQEPNQLPGPETVRPWASGQVGRHEGWEVFSAAPSGPGVSGN